MRECSTPEGIGAAVTQSTRWGRLEIPRGVVLNARRHRSGEITRNELARLLESRSVLVLNARRHRSGEITGSWRHVDQ